MSWRVTASMPASSAMSSAPKASTSPVLILIRCRQSGRIYRKKIGLCTAVHREAEGEIALRVVRTVRDLGGTSILPYTPEDLLSPAAEFADEAHALPEGSSYTDTAAILDLARRTGADAIHPGYGFLSEHADFARAVMDAGITWVGPSQIGRAHV